MAARAPQFTPGPWSVRDMPWATGTKHYIDAGGGVVATTLSRQSVNPADKAQVLANARLIAAAPELYEALIGLLPIVFTGSPTNEQNIAHWERERDLGNGQAPAVLAAYAALAKARGESDQ